ncbi:hypothetical protein L873DRAFT_1723767 [Choiromyces venosus 120613-1]|uniref:Vacuolar import and degradation protein-domain-containing protein n=1 Tax=Choiromyces venosus 120613-1 TaxID=1336337 RepID=A0A3N4IUJ1_9PEZI|nr:hypothetical protein L873DRAFT_1723767 [Choiromyces venosus 120613-1]
MPPPANSPSNTPPSFASSFHVLPPPSVDPSAFPLSRTEPSPLLHSLPQQPLLDDEDDEREEVARSRIRALYGADTRVFRHLAELTRPNGSEQRMRRSGSGRMRQSLRDSEARQPQDQAYGARIPSWRPGQRQSLYDWAPATPPEEDSESRHTAGRTLAGMFEGLINARSESSTRSSSFMQSLRPPNRRPIRSRPQWHGYSWERERERQREGREDSFTYHEWNNPEVIHRSRPIRIRGENFRDSSSSSSSSSYELEEVIKYLAKLRSSSGPQESLLLAEKAGFGRSDDWMEFLDEEARCDDLLLDTHFLNVAETSWLKVGGIFWGSQTAPSVSPVAPLRSNHSSASSTSYLPSNTTTAAASRQDESRRVPGRTSPYTNNPHKWTVKVSISSIDYAQLRLTGTMEAFTDFQASSTERKTSITTYLEGEIIDFKTHSLETFNFHSNIKDDANNWRKLEPFSRLSDDQLVKSLVSKKFMKNLTDNWIFMRWKEKCFITPQTSPDAGVLTIGGFYFLSLRRSDGQIQGFYYDPQSQPYQELILKPQERMFPTYAFR